jgi:predicted MPP superfamily phosphohydrolase
MFFVVSLLATVGFSLVLYYWAVDTFPALARHKWLVAFALAALVVGAPPVARVAAIFWHVGGAISSIVLIVVATLALAAIPIGAMHAAFWAAYRRRKLRGRVEPALVQGMTRRQLVEAAGGGVFLGTAGSVLAWGAVRGRHAFELREVAVRIGGLPRALDGYVIAQISDIHAGTYVAERELREGLDRVREARADLVVVTGDMVDLDKRFGPLVARMLADLAPRDGVTAVLGNHDYYTGADSVAGSLRDAGIDVLVDAGKVIRPNDGGGFALLGVDDLRATSHGRPGPRLDRALSMVPGGIARILLSHQPQTVERWPGRVALQLSGHTHGGQINPGFRPAALFLEYIAGRYLVGGTTLYVNSGFGTVGPPSRVGAPPEVSRIVLVSA